jgi:NDP-sugar pyrophosphorylase family protein
MSFKVIILAGGKGERLSCADKGIPKPLIKIGSKTILEHQIDWLESYGFSNVRLSLGFEAKKIIDYIKELGKNYEYVIEEESLGTGGAIKFACSDFQEPFLLLNGDILTDLNLKEFEESFRKLSAENMIASFKCEDPRDFGLLKMKEDRITGFLEKPKEIDKGNDYYVNTGIYILSPENFKNFSKKKFSIEKDFFPKAAEREELTAFKYQGFWMDVGTEERLKKAKEIYKL